MKIRGSLLEESREAIKDAFTLETLAMAWRLMEGVDSDLSDVVGTNDGFEKTVDRTLVYVDKHDLELPFIEALRKQNPTNIRLQHVAAKVEAQLALPEDEDAGSDSAEPAPDSPASPATGSAWTEKLPDNRILIGAAAGIIILIILVAILWPSPDTPPVVVTPDDSVAVATEISTPESGTGVSEAGTGTSREFESPASADFEIETFTIGQAADGSSITAIRLGTGDNVAVFIGGFHAGYAPSSQTIAQRIATYLEENPDQLPDSVRVYVVPNANPTTEYAPGVRSSRLNANGVDLNRNWDCNWSADATFAGLPIGSGSEPFSEPEAQALKSLVESVAPQAVIVWGARARSGLVAPGGCDNQTQVSVPLALAYSRAAGYSLGTFDPDNIIPGDVTNWLAGIGVPAIYVLTPDYVDPDWPDSLRGIEAVIDWLQ